MKIIGLSGKAGTGKDWIAAQYLRAKGYVPVALADAVKEQAVFRGLLSYEEAFLTKPPTARTLLQKLGTEQGRDLWGEDCWCRLLQARLLEMSRRWGVERAVITDVRFPNEVHFVQDELGGEVYRIFAPDRHANTTLTAEQRAHSSETALDVFDPDGEALAQGRFQLKTVVVRAAADGREVEESLFDAIIDNRVSAPISLDQQLTQILRLHDHIGPTEVVFAHG